MGMARNPLPVNTPSAVRLWHLSNIVFAAAGIVAILCASRRTANSPAERRQRRWVLALCVAWMCVRVAWRYTEAPWLVLLKDACPLVFIFIVTYYVERLTFFDVLIKKGVVAFFSISLLSIYFTWLTPWMDHFRLGILVWALSAWPIVLLNPWLQRRISAWIDRLWLGRRFSPIEASERFLDGLQGAISEPELAGLAEQRLRVIFQSEAEVLLDPSPPPGEGDGHESMLAPIRRSGEQVGLIRVQRRAHNPRFLSEDVALLASLAEVFSFLLENLRLREKRLQHEKREYQLVLNANQSELKALRAQVNPHFLFNALNTIASLIPRQPDRAERTIEQLAELFRYTLRRSDQEWVTVDEELEVVCAYLDVEQARFGDRLATRIEASGEARQMRIPAMIVQTLVENAVKHGVGRIRTQGVVEVNAEVSASGLRIAVGDNGPGFPSTATRALPAGNGGYGLRNIRERLQGHFGETASLTVDRDTALGMTVVSLRLPRAAPQPAEARAQ
jgi:GAF domain-containing protein